MMFFFSWIRPTQRSVRFVLGAIVAAVLLILVIGIINRMFCSTTPSWSVASSSSRSFPTNPFHAPAAASDPSMLPAPSSSLPDESPSWQDIFQMFVMPKQSKYGHMFESVPPPPSSLASSPSIPPPAPRKLPPPPQQPSRKKDSQGEETCREFLQFYFGKEFPKVRPAFLQNPVTGDKLELDCYNKEIRLAVEYHGSQHYFYNEWIHKGSKQNFYNQQYRDLMKKELCQKHGVELISVPFSVPNDEIPEYLWNELKNRGYPSIHEKTQCPESEIPSDPKDIPMSPPNEY